MGFSPNCPGDDDLAYVLSLFFRTQISPMIISPTFFSIFFRTLIDIAWTGLAGKKDSLGGLGAVDFREETRLSMYYTTASAQGHMWFGLPCVATSSTHRPCATRSPELRPRPPRSNNSPAKLTRLKLTSGLTLIHQVERCLSCQRSAQFSKWASHLPAPSARVGSYCPQC